MSDESTPVQPLITVCLLSPFYLKRGTSKPAGFCLKSADFSSQPFAIPRAHQGSLSLCKSTQSERQVTNCYLTPSKPMNESPTQSTLSAALRREYLPPPHWLLEKGSLYPLPPNRAVCVWDGYPAELTGACQRFAARDGCDEGRAVYLCGKYFLPHGPCVVHLWAALGVAPEFCFCAVLLVEFQNS